MPDKIKLCCDHSYPGGQCGLVGYDHPVICDHRCHGTSEESYQLNGSSIMSERIKTLILTPIESHYRWYINSHKLSQDDYPRLYQLKELRGVDPKKIVVIDITNGKGCGFRYTEYWEIRELLSARPYTTYFISDDVHPDDVLRSTKERGVQDGKTA